MKTSHGTKKPRAQSAPRSAAKGRKRVTLLVGLGNPGPEYAITPHNLGFTALDAIAATLHATPFKHERRFTADAAVARFGGDRIILAKPQTMMNRSGIAVHTLTAYYKIPASSVWIVHDDLDLPIGAVRHSFDSRAAGHRGVQSIIDELGTQAFHRLRIGIGRPERGPADAYVLRPMSAAMKWAMAPAVQSTTDTFLRQIVSSSDHAVEKHSRHHQPVRRSLGQ